MNTNKTHRIRIACYTTAVTVVAIAGTVGAASPGSAAPAHGDGEGGGATSAISPYAQPLEALGGMTLAQYVQQHQAGDPRTFAGV
jgi:hypothetical protein